MNSLLRRWIQIAAVFLSNASWKFPFTRNIYQGELKAVCTPGLNCYSCPAATVSCPLGAIQNFMAGVRPSFTLGHPHLGLYVIGFLGFIGSIVGRMPCAWLCPFGLLQELIYKIPSRKFAIPKVLTWGKYVFLALFIFILPLMAVDEFGYSAPWFCKYVCPAGTLEAGIPLMALKPVLREMIGWLFYSKLFWLGLFLIWMVFSKMPFCRTVCPLGAIYALFNRISVFKMVHHSDRCTRCDACYRDCPMGIKFYEGPNQADCIRCMKCLNESCKFGAISYSLEGLAPKRTVRIRTTD